MKPIAVAILLALGAGGVSWLLARLCRVRLRRHELALIVALPLAVIAPWLGPTILAPVDELQASAQLLTAQMKPPGPSQRSLMSDVTHQFLPWEVEVRRALAARRLPEWSDLLGGGACLLCNPQARVLDPIAFVARLATPLQEHLEATTVLQLGIAIGGGIVAAARIGVAGPARALAGVAWGLGGATTAWALYPNGAAAAWLGWLLASLIDVARARRRLARSICTCATILACAILAGNPQVVLWALPVLGAVAWWCAGSRRRSPPTPLSGPSDTFEGRLGGAGAAARLALAATAGVLLAAPALLPFAALAPDSARAAEKRGQHVSMPSGAHDLFLAGGEKLVVSALDPRAFGLPFVDEFRGPTNWLESLSVHSGPFALLGALLALVARRSRRRATLLLAVAAIGWLVGGGFTPILALLELIPGGDIPSHTRALPLVPLAFALLLGLGAGELSRVSPRQRLALAALAACALLALLGPSPRALLLLTVAAAALAACERLPRTAVSLLGVAIALDLVLVAHQLLPHGEPHHFYPRTEAIEQIAVELAAPGGPWRVMGESYEVYPSKLAILGFADARPHDPLAGADLMRVFGAVFDHVPNAERWYQPFAHVEHPLVDFLGVRVVVSNYAQPPKHRFERLHEAWRYGMHELWRNPSALPRAFVPHRVEAVADSEIEHWLHTLEDPRRVAVARQPPCDSPTGSVVITHFSPGRLTFELDGNPCLVATSIPMVRGWRAANVRGEPLPTVPIDLAFLGVTPGGMRVVRLEYRAPGLRLGVGLAAAAALLLGMLAALEHRGGRPLRIPSRLLRRLGRVLATLALAAPCAALLAYLSLGAMFAIWGGSGHPPLPRAPDLVFYGVLGLVPLVSLSAGWWLTGVIATRWRRP